MAIGSAAIDPKELRSGGFDGIRRRLREQDPQKPSARAADVRRHLEHQPVLAGRPGAWYRARKFARRHQYAITAREVLDRGAAKIDRELASDPVLQAELMQTIGRAYFSLGLFSRAEGLFARALEIRKRVLGPEHADTLLSLNAVGRAYWGQGRYLEAEKLHREALGHGFSRADWMAKDANLASLRGDPEFERLLATARSNAGK